MEIEVSVRVPVDPVRAFAVFSEDIGEWWRDYYNAPDVTGLRLEPGIGGRLIELQGEDDGFEVGRVTAWEPGRRLALTWRQADWADDESTEVEVTFAPVPGGTRVTLEHRGWDEISSDPSGGEGYAEGWEELLGWYATASAG